MKLILGIALLFASVAQGAEFSYDEIAKRHKDVRLTESLLNNARMQGECLVGLKELNFKRKKDFDPVAEWTNFRSVSLLEQFPPCQVLVIMEVAQKELKKQN